VDNRILYGLVLLAGIIGMQMLMRFVRQRRLMRAWQTAEAGLQDGEEGIARAETALRKCLKIEPLWTPARMLLADVLARQGRLEEAEAEHKLSADLHPREVEGHVRLALFYVAHQPERKEDALRALRAALECAPDGDNGFLADPRFIPLHAEADWPRG
jgi:Flp pilus assembly protein TadD